MTVTEVIQGLGSWTLQLSPQTPKHITAALGFFGHVAIVPGPVDVAASGDGLLAGARYVGVVRKLPKPDEKGQQIAGSGMVFWLGDEDGKGAVIESELDCSGMTLTQAVTAILNPVTAVEIGTIYPKAGTLPANTRFLFVSPRQALQDVCDAFGVEFRVNGDATVDVGTQAQLYNAVPDTIIVRKGAGSDPDLRGLSGSFDVDSAVYDWSDRVVLVGRTLSTEETPEELFVTATAELPENPFVNLFGFPVAATRIISDSTVNEGTAQARADLNLNRFGRVVRSFRLLSDDYDVKGGFVVGDQVLVYDPDTGIVNSANERIFRGRLVHPDSIRVNEASWNVRSGFTVAYRDQGGTWYDLTPFVTAETDASDELVVGDLPRSVSRPSDNPLQSRVDAARPDSTFPSAPGNLTLGTEAYVTPAGNTVALISASWDKPTTNQDGTAYTDHSHYLIQSRWIGRVFGEGATRTEDTDAELRGLTVNLEHEVRVAAVDRSGNVGAWATETIITEDDDIAPDTPADGVLSSFLGMLRLDWPGTDSAGGPMSVDTKQINVHIGAPGFVISPANRVDALPPFGKGSGVYSWPVGTPAAIQLQAEDHSGNLSAPSAQVTRTPTALGDGEIGSLSVAKLLSGTVTAVVVVGNRIVASPAGLTTGQRTELWTGGLRSFDGSENLTINFDGVNNLLTGVLQTALSGRRIVIGTGSDIFGSGATGGSVDIIAPDGTTASLTGFTAGGSEGVWLGVVVGGGGPTYASWNGFQAQESQAVFAVSRTVDLIFGSGGTAGAGAFVVEQTNNHAIYTAGARRARYQIDPTYHIWWQPVGTNRRVQIGPNSSGAVANESPVLTWVSDNNYGAGIKFGSDSGGGNATLIVCTPDGASYHNIMANAFLPPSDEALKDEIAPVTGLLDELLAADEPVISYRLKGERQGRKTRRKDTEVARKGVADGALDVPDVLAGDLGREHFGLSANRVPARMRVQTPDGMLAYDLAAGLALALGSIRELAAEVRRLNPEEGEQL